MFLFFLSSEQRNRNEYPYVNQFLLKTQTPQTVADDVIIESYPIYTFSLSKNTFQGKIVKGYKNKIVIEWSETSNNLINDIFQKLNMKEKTKFFNSLQLQVNHNIMSINNYDHSTTTMTLGEKIKDIHIGENINIVNPSTTQSIHIYLPCDKNLYINNNSLKNYYLFQRSTNQYRQIHNYDIENNIFILNEPFDILNYDNNNITTLELRKKKCNISYNTEPSLHNNDPTKIIVPSTSNFEIKLINKQNQHYLRFVHQQTTTFHRITQIEQLNENLLLTIEPARYNVFSLNDSFLFYEIYTNIINNYHNLAYPLSFQNNRSILGNLKLINIFIPNFILQNNQPLVELPFIFLEITGTNLGSAKSTNQIITNVNQIKYKNIFILKINGVVKDTNYIDFDIYSNDIPWDLNTNQDIQISLLDHNGDLLNIPVDYLSPLQPNKNIQFEIICQFYKNI